MEYDYVTIDTNIITQNGYRLELGLLAQFRQFKSGSVKFVLSEIVVREMARHMRERAAKAKDAFETAMKNSIEQGLVAPEKQEATRETFSSMPDARDATKSRIESFLRDTGAEIVRVGNADMNDLVGNYFSAKPPFERSGKKKNEFPDAIALLSMEKWAAEKQQKILAISADMGWKEFAATSDWIDVVEDTSKALQLIQDGIERARILVTEFTQEIASSSNTKDFEQIETAVGDELQSLMIFAEADSYLSVDVQEVEVQLVVMEFVQDGNGYAFDIVQVGNHKVVVNITVNASIEADAECYFYVHDSIDDDEVYMGSSPASTTSEVQLNVLVSFLVHEADGPDFEIEDVELADTSIDIDFGYVEPEWDEPDNEYT